jgi:hypothetical protein
MVAAGVLRTVALYAAHQTSARRFYQPGIEAAGFRARRFSSFRSSLHVSAIVISIG